MWRKPRRGGLVKVLCTRRRVFMRVGGKSKVVKDTSRQSLDGVLIPDATNISRGSPGGQDMFPRGMSGCRVTDCGYDYGVIDWDDGGDFQIEGIFVLLICCEEHA